MSASRSRLYFLDGGAQVDTLTPAGVVVAVTRLPGAARTRVAFAISSDDRQMAVSVLTYTGCDALSRASAHIVAYTAALHGGRRYDFFASSKIAEWPVAWYGRAVVPAVGPFGAQQPAPNPAGAVAGYHTADPVTGLREAAVCTGPGDHALGPLTPAGTLCLHASRGLELVSWAGIAHHITDLLPPVYDAVLAPDGSRVAYSSADGYVLVQRVGAVRAVSTPFKGVPLGFLDGTHLIMQAPASSSAYTVLDVRSGAARRIAGLPRSASLSVWGSLSTAP